ncbi:MAG TPA: FtsX-like permease family protein [candidate division Zixibacteria bacterium]|nr:FtsX-like permease family protein [candidate division Zixibacteria bacterium]
MNRFRFILRKFIGNIVSRPMAALGSLLSLFLLFLLFDLVWITSMTVNNYYDKIISEIDIEVFLDDAIPDSTITIIKDVIGSLDGIESIDFISRDDARRKLNDMIGVDLLEGFENNPLPRSMIISFEPDYLNSDNLNTLNRDLQRMAGVTDIYYPSRWLVKAEYTKLIVSEILILLGIVIAVAVILNTIHFIVLSARTRAEELVQLRLLGAGPAFLAVPYIFEGVFYALAASLGGLVVILYGVDLFSFRNIDIILPPTVEWFYFCLAGSLIGLIGGYLGIRREL